MRILVNLLTKLSFREIPRNAAEDSPRPGLGSRLAARFARVGLDQDIPELRGHPAEPAVFDE